MDKLDGRTKKQISLGKVSPPKEPRTVDYRHNFMAEATEFILKTPSGVILHGLILDEDPTPTLRKLWWLTMTPMEALFEFPIGEGW